MCSRRRRRDDVEALFAALDSAAGLDLVAEHDLVAGIGEGGNKAERAVAIDRPPGERARDLDDVLPRVAAVGDARVQFEQIAPVVLVQPTHAFLALRGIARLIRLRPRHARYTTSKPPERASVKN